MVDRRDGIERRATPRDTAERRGPGRPRTPDETKPRTLHVKVPPWLHDAVCRIALRRGMAVNAILRRMIERGANGGEL
jgi:hypothetical protein